MEDTPALVSNACLPYVTNTSAGFARVIAWARIGKSFA